MDILTMSAPEGVADCCCPRINFPNKEDIWMKIRRTTKFLNACAYDVEHQRWC